MAGLSTFDRLAGELAELLRDQDYPAEAEKIPGFVAWFNATKSGGPWSDLDIVDHCLCDEAAFHECGRWFQRQSAAVAEAEGEGVRS